MNIERYLQRMNYNDTTSPTIGTLKTLQETHLLNIPFENLDIHYGRKIILDKQAIFEKVMDNQRGGFCYELNGLFYELLRSLGFTVKIISARVYNSTTQEYGVEYDHLAVIATIDGIDYLADVGFGEFAFHPLKIELDTLQQDPRGVFTIQQYDDEYLQVSKQASTGWIPEYIFSMKERSFQEFEGMCLYHQTSPLSHFTRGKLCSRPTIQGRITITGEKIKITEGEQLIEQKLDSEDEFTAAILKYFNIRLDAIPANGTSALNI